MSRITIALSLSHARWQVLVNAHVKTKGKMNSKKVVSQESECELYFLLGGEAINKRERERKGREREEMSPLALVNVKYHFQLTHRERKSGEEEWRGRVERKERCLKKKRKYKKEK